MKNITTFRNAVLFWAFLTGGVYSDTILEKDLTLEISPDRTALQINNLVTAVPKNLGGHTLLAQLENGLYNREMTSALLFRGFFNGNLIIRGNPAESGQHTDQAVIIDASAGMDNVFNLSRCSAAVTIQNLCLKVSDTSRAACIRLSGLQQVAVDGCYLIGAGKINGNIGVHAATGVLGEVSNCCFENTANGIKTDFACLVTSSNNTSVGTIPDYGLKALEFTKILKEGSQPSGWILGEDTSRGGTIE